MFKKKIFAMMAVFTFVLSMASTCLAANWIWIDSTDKISIYFDSDTAHYYEETRDKYAHLDFWVKVVDTEGNYTIAFERIRRKSFGSGRFTLGRRYLVTAYCFRYTASDYMFMKTFAFFAK